MYRSALLLLCAVLPFWLAPATTARAESAGGPPTGIALLPAALLATALHGSAHLSGTLGLGAPGAAPAVNASVSGNAAVSGRIRAAVQITPSGAGAALLGGAAISLVLKGKYLAVRTGKQKWSCTNLATSILSGKLTGLKLPIPGLAVAPLLAVPTLQAPVDLGAEMLNGLPVWHLQAKSIASRGTPAGIDFYVNQANLSLARVALTSILAGSTPIALSLTLDFSQYGRRVKVAFPKVCKPRANSTRG